MLECAAADHARMCQLHRSSYSIYMGHVVAADLEAAFVAQLACQRLEQRRLASRRRPQQQGGAARRDDAADVVQDRHLALLRSQEARLDERILHASDGHPGQQ